MTLRRPHPRTVPAITVALGAAALACLLPASPAAAASSPGQAVADDYGQSDAEVAVEIAAAVAADPSVVHWKAVAATDRRVVLARVAAEAKAGKAYSAAVRSKKRTRITATHKALLGSHALTVKAKAVYAAAVKKRDAVIASRTSAVTGAHFRPVDGTFDGRLVKYLVPTVPFSFEPMQVRITVYGGHVSDISVITQADPLSDSGTYNTRSLSTLTLEAMSAGDTANVASVSGASLSSEAFSQSLQSALVAAGFKG